MTDSSLPTHIDAVVIGAGAAGLGAAASLRKQGVEAVVLEHEETVGATWRQRYDGLRLNTVRWMSGLPGRRIPRSAGRWPSRDAFVTYLENYAADNSLDVRYGVRVSRVTRCESGFSVETSKGELEARVVVVATGHDHTPFVPDWPGLRGFGGEFLHASAYRNAAPFRGRHVLVVGMGNTGSEIAVELLEGGAASVRVAMRTAPNILRREIFGIPATVMGAMSEMSPAFTTDLTGIVLQRLLWGDLRRLGIPRAPYGLATEISVKGMGPMMDDGFIEALRGERLQLIEPVSDLNRDGAVLADGEHVRADVVIAATGYRCGLEPLVGHLGVLLPSGLPSVVGPQTAPEAPQLYFMGYSMPLSGPLPAMSRHARGIARAAARHIRRAPTPAPAAPRPGAPKPARGLGKAAD